MRAELMIVLAGLIADRDRKGAEWCRKHGVGKRRRVLSSQIAPNVIVDNSDALAILEAHCRACGKCKLAFTAASPQSGTGRDGAGSA